MVIRLWSEIFPRLRAPENRVSGQNLYTRSNRRARPGLQDGSPFPRRARRSDCHGDCVSTLDTRTNTSRRRPMKVSFSPATTAPAAPAGLKPLQSLCQLQAEQLVSQLPVRCLLIAYYDPKLGTRQYVTHYAPGAAHLPGETLEFLTSQTWLDETVPATTLQDLSLKSVAGVGYLCPLIPRDPHPEYLFLISEVALSPDHKQLVERTAALLARHLELHQQCWRQKSEIELLEQVVQRTGHQLRNPLALISLYAENLCIGLANSPASEQATIIRETVNTLNTNLTELIYCGQGARLQATRQDLRAIVEESIEGLRPWIECKQLHIRYPDSALMLAVDRLQLKQVFDNLLSNAVHFSPPTGTIDLRWRSFQDEVLIEVSDQGPGLSTQDLQQVFTPFYSRRPGGTGLGLAIAKKIILDHQGSLWVQNLPTGGAQFSISLPRGSR